MVLKTLPMDERWRKTCGAKCGPTKWQKDEEKPRDEVKARMWSLVRMCASFPFLFGLQGKEAQPLLFMFVVSPACFVLEETRIPSMEFKRKQARKGNKNNGQRNEREIYLKSWIHESGKTTQGHIMHCPLATHSWQRQGCGLHKLLGLFTWYISYPVNFANLISLSLVRPQWTTVVNLHLYCFCTVFYSVKSVQRCLSSKWKKYSFGMVQTAFLFSE